MRARSLAMVLSAILACTVEDPRPSAAGGLNVWMRIGGSEAPPAGFQGVIIDIAPNVPYRLFNTVENGQARKVETLNGLPFHYEGGVLRIADRTYGTVKPGDQVTIGLDGVKVNGTSWGPFPH